MSKSAKNKEKPLDENDIPLMELTKRRQEKERADKYVNNNTSAEDQRPVNEVSSFNEHRKVMGYDLTESYLRHVLKFNGFIRCS